VKKKIFNAFIIVELNLFKSYKVLEEMPIFSEKLLIVILLSFKSSYNISTKYNIIIIPFSINPAVLAGFY